MTVSGWVLVAAVAGVVAVVCAALLLTVGLVGARRGSSSGPLVVVGRVLFSVLLVAVLVALVAALVVGIMGAFASFG